MPGAREGSNAGGRGQHEEPPVRNQRVQHREQRPREQRNGEIGEATSMDGAGSVEWNCSSARGIGRSAGERSREGSASWGERGAQRGINRGGGYNHWQTRAAAAELWSRQPAAAGGRATLVGRFWLFVLGIGP
jgi:hypothetical protein